MQTLPTGAQFRLNIPFSMKLKLMKSISFLFVAVGLGATALSTYAGEASLSVRAFAHDTSLDLSGEQSFGTPASFQATASATALYQAGLARSYSHVDAS